MYKKSLLPLLTLLASALQLIDSANILVFLPSTTRSHFKPFEHVFVELAKRGHNMTIMSKFPPKSEIANYTHFEVKENYNFSGSGFAKLRAQNRVQNYMHLYRIVSDYFASIFEDSRLTKLLNAENTHFDLVFAELYHGDIAFALASKFNASLIGLSFQPLQPVYGWLLKTPITFSYIPHLYLPYSDTMTFFQRLLNALFGVFTILFYNYVSARKYQNDMEAALPSVKAANLHDLVTKNMSLVFVESHFTAGYARPYPPNVIEVAGVHIKPLQNLPQDVQLFLDNSKNGVIYVSLGSIIEPNLIRETGLKLLAIFSNIPYDVLWKWEPTLLPSIPQNILVREWLPQLEILSHPSCKLFLSHGGYHSVIEAIYTGMPILSIPFFTDQYYNTAIIKKLQIGDQLDLENLENHLHREIRKLIANKKYKRNAQHQSKLFRDRPVDPLNLTIYWTEYVIKYKDAAATTRLNSPATELYWFQLLLIDVILFYLFILIALIFALKRITSIIFYRLFRKPAFKHKKE